MKGKALIPIIGIFLMSGGLAMVVINNKNKKGKTQNTDLLRNVGYGASVLGLGLLFIKD